MRLVPPMAGSNPGLFLFSEHLRRASHDPLANAMALMADALERSWRTEQSLESWPRGYFKCVHPRFLVLQTKAIQSRGSSRPPPITTANSPAGYFRLDWNTSSTALRMLLTATSAPATGLGGSRYVISSFRGAGGLSNFGT